MPRSFGFLAAALVIGFLSSCSSAPGRPATCLQRFAVCPKATERLVCQEGKSGCDNCHCVPEADPAGS